MDRAIAKVKDGCFAAEDYGARSFDEVGRRSLAPLGTFEDKVPAEGRQGEEREAEIKDGALPRDQR